MSTLQEQQTLSQKQHKILMNGAGVVVLKQKLADTDYKALKFAEGELTAEEYAPVREERRALRAKINTLEAEIKQLEG